jgi:Skp family chaperone for outer membrane proteins
MNDRIYKFGSALALLLMGILVGGGFQAATEKTGVVDINSLIETSNFGKSVRETLDKMRSAREDVLGFIDSNRVLTLEQATRLRDLTLKMDRTAAESAEIDTLKAQVVVANKKWMELATKGTLTPEERTLQQEYADRAQKMSDLGTRWVRDFTNDIDAWLDKQKADSASRAREAINATAKAQGYTMVYDKAFAPYGANDITDPSLAAMNAKP